MRLVGFLICLLFVGDCTAQPGPSWTVSIEWLTMDSPLIIRGKVISSEAVEKYGSARKIVFRVDETLKGETQAELTFVAQGDGYPEELTARWARTGAEVLAFMVEAAPMRATNTILAAHPYRYTAFSGRVAQSMFELNPRAGVQVLSMSMESLSDPTLIVEHVRAALKFTPAQSCLVSPVGVTKMPVRMAVTGMGVRMTVPVDSRLETLARGWLRSPFGSTRVEGLKAIALFKSPENIREVQHLLKDPFTENYMWSDHTGGTMRSVREAAKDTLDGWDVLWEGVHPASVLASREMIKIPAGQFIAGGTPGAEDAGPAHKVTLPAFWIGKTPVTVAQFRAFCTATGFAYDWKKFRPSHGYKDDHPMVSVNWEEARAFCKWVGGDLPTDDQWEKAARGTDGRRFPWGNTFSLDRLQSWENSLIGWRTTAPVGSFPKGASPYGALDMTGNVWQWCLGGAPTRRSTRGSDFESSSDDLRFTQVAGRGSMHGEARLESQGFRVVGTRKLKLP